MTSSRLQTEIGKRHPFGTPAEEAYLNLLRTSDRLQIEFSRLFRRFGLTPSQYNILRILRGQGTPLPILEIARRTVTVVPGITGLIDRLEKAGWVKRQRCEKDRRVIHVEISSDGRRVLGEIDQPVAQTLERLFIHFEKPEFAEFIRLLEKARANASADGGDPTDSGGDSHVDHLES